MLQSYSILFKGSKMVRHCPTWSKIVQNDSTLFKIVQNGPNWSNAVQIIQISSNGPKYSNMAQIGLSMFKWVQQVAIWLIIVKKKLVIFFLKYV